jgi:Protein of unknown function (DUF2490)
VIKKTDGVHPMLQRGKYPYLANVLLVIAIFSIQAAAQDKNIWNEYRPSLVFAMPINDKWIAWQYNVLVYAPEKKLTTLGITGPGITYRVNAKKGDPGWLELWAGTLFASTDNYHDTNSFEVRPVVGVRVFVPNKKKVNIFNFARYEYRLFFQDHHTTSQPRFRNRVALEIPLAKGDKRWTPRTFYTVADVEPFWRLDDKFLEKIRVRGTVGYIIKKRMAVEMIYHAEFAGSKGAPKKFVGNLWRVNLKFLFARGKSIFPRIDIDD